MLKALEGLKTTALQNSNNLVQVLLGQKRPLPPQTINDITFFDETLNESQKDAVKFALGSHEIALIHGPPGKTCIRKVFNRNAMLTSAVLLRGQVRSS